MRSASRPFSDFNQMLVMSVLFHCLALGISLFVKETILAPKIIRPAFQVQLVEIPRGENRPAAKPVAAVPEKSRPVQGAVEQPKPLTPVKKTVPPKKAERIARAKPVPAKKSQPVKAVKPASPDRTLIKELDQVASLAVKPRSVPAKPTRDEMVEQQIRDLETLKVESPVVPRQEPRLDPVQPDPGEIPLAVRKEKELEFEKLVNDTAMAKAETVKPQPEKLLKELESISTLSSQKVDVPEMPKVAAVPDAVGQDAGREIERLKEQLDSLKLDSGRVKIEVAKEPVAASPEFKSRINDLAAPDPNKTFVVASMPGAGEALSASATVQANRAGTPGADILSQYVALVERLVLGNWKSPIGAERNEVKASFHIYPAGNINRASLVKSSGNDLLDNLALRAINDSEPFPPFPEALKEPNLHITIHFHYVFQENPEN